MLSFFLENGSTSSYASDHRCCLYIDRGGSARSEYIYMYISVYEHIDIESEQRSKRSDVTAFYTW